MKKYHKRDKINLKVEIRLSPIHGKGMFALVPIRGGEVVAIWGGNFVSRAEAIKAKATGQAIQQIDDDVFEVFNSQERGEGPPHISTTIRVTPTPGCTTK